MFLKKYFKLLFLITANYGYNTGDDALDRHLIECEYWLIIEEEKDYLTHASVSFDEEKQKNITYNSKTDLSNYEYNQNESKETHSKSEEIALSELEIKKTIDLKEDFYEEKDNNQKRLIDENEASIKTLPEQAALKNDINSKLAQNINSVKLENETEASRYKIVSIDDIKKITKRLKQRKANNLLSQDPNARMSPIEYLHWIGRQYPFHYIMDNFVLTSLNLVENALIWRTVFNFINNFQKFVKNRQIDNPSQSDKKIDHIADNINPWSKATIKFIKSITRIEDTELYNIFGIVLPIILWQMPALSIFLAPDIGSIVFSILKKLIFLITEEATLIDYPDLIEKSVSERSVYQLLNKSILYYMRNPNLTPIIQQMPTTAKNSYITSKKYMNNVLNLIIHIGARTIFTFYFDNCSSGKLIFDHCSFVPFLISSIFSIFSIYLYYNFQKNILPKNQQEFFNEKLKTEEHCSQVLQNIEMTTGAYFVKKELAIFEQNSAKELEAEKKLNKDKVKASALLFLIFIGHIFINYALRASFITDYKAAHSALIDFFINNKTKARSLELYLPDARSTPDLRFLYSSIYKTLSVLLMDCDFVFRLNDLLSIFSNGEFYNLQKQIQLVECSDVQNDSKLMAVPPKDPFTKEPRGGVAIDIKNFRIVSNENRELFTAVAKELISDN